MQRRHLLTSLALAAALGLSACGSTYTVSADVSTFGKWPEGRAAGSFAFERMPSQQQDDIKERMDKLEQSARAALEKAGFKMSEDPKSADVLVSIGMVVSPNERLPWDDPIYWRWHGGYASWHCGPGWYGGGWRRPVGPCWSEPRYDRSVAVLIRDRVSGEPLYEVRAGNDGMTMGDDVLIGALYEAGLSEFPKVEPKPHRVSVQVPRS